MPLTHEQVVQRLNEASAAYTAHNWQQAADIYGELFVEPNALGDVNPIHWNYAVCLSHLGQHDLAVQHMQAGGYTEDQYRSALASSSDESDRHAAEQQANHAQFQYALDLYNGQHWQQAAEAFTALLVSPGFPAGDDQAIHYNIATCYAHLGDWPTAETHIQASGHSDAELREVFQRVHHEANMAQFQHAMQLFEGQQWEHAAEAFAQLLLSPGFPVGDDYPIHFNIAMCYAHLGQWDTAFEHIRAGNHDEHAFREALTHAGLTPPH